MDSPELSSLDIAEFFNSEFGNDLSNLNKLEEVIDRISKYEEELEREVSFYYYTVYKCISVTTLRCNLYLYRVFLKRKLGFHCFSTCINLCIFSLTKTIVKCKGTFMIF